VLNISTLNGYNGLVLRSHTESPLLFGMRVGRAGDLNADGVADMLVAAPSTPAAATAFVYVIYGSKLWGLDNTSSALFLDTSRLGVDGTGYAISGAGIGQYCTTLGDTNGDGLGDIITGSAAEAVVIFGSRALRKSLDADALLAADGYYLSPPSPSPLSSPQPDSISAVSGGCDVNGDGYGDIIVGDSSYDDSAGVTYVVYGKPFEPRRAPSGQAAEHREIPATGGEEGFRVYGEFAAGESGAFVSCTSDMDGDGVQDFVVGAPGVNASTGEAYVVFVRASYQGVSEVRVMDGSRALRVLGAAPGGRCGASVLGLGDLDAEGHSDLLVSAHLVGGGLEVASAAAAQAGEVYVVSVTPKEFARSSQQSSMQQSLFAAPVTPAVVEGKVRGFFGSYVGYFAALFLLLLLVDKLGVFRESSRVLTESAFRRYASKYGGHARTTASSAEPPQLAPLPAERDSRLTWHTEDFNAYPAEFYTYLE
jgi:hypothetical protein